MTTETQLKPMIEVDMKDVFALVLKPQNLLDEAICGRSMEKWIDATIEGWAHRKIEVQKNDDIMGIIKNSVIDKKYCVVIYADTPLLTRQTIEQALSFVASYGHNAAQMPRGWVFDTEFVKSCINVQTVAVPNMPEEDFIVAYNYAQLALINTYMRERINNAHMSRGVYITDPYNVYIDADVKIGKGTKIGPGCVLRGVSKIGSNCEIDCGVTFCNDVNVGDNTFVGAASILVGPVTIGERAHIAEGSTISSDVPSNSFGIGRARQAVKENWKPGQPE